MNDTRIKFRHIIGFLEIVRCGNVGRAAQSLNIAQPALSRSMKELEAVVGAKLLQRGRRGSRLTGAGETFFRFAAPGIAQIRNAYNLAAPGMGRGETIVIGSLPEAVALLPAAFTEIRRREPATTLRVLHGTNADHLIRLRHGDLSMVVGRIAAADLLAGLAFEHLHSEAVCCVVRRGHRLDNGRAISASDLADHSLVLHQPDTVVRSEVDRFLFSQGINVLGDHVETDSMELARSLTLDDDRIWIAPMGAVSRDIADGRLAQVAVKNWQITASVGVTTNPTRTLTRGEEIVIAALRDVSKSLAWNQR